MEPVKQRVGRRPASHRHAEYPKLLYHSLTGQQRVVGSGSEEDALGPEWGLAQTDVKYSKTPPPIMPEPSRPRVFTINIPGADE